MHWLLGSFSDLTGIDLHVTYWVAWGLLVLAVVWAVHAMLMEVGLSRAGYWLCMGTFVATPYVFRFYAIAPGLLADLVFVAGLAFTLLGLVRRSPVLTCAAIAVAALGRENALLLAVVAAGYWILTTDRETRRGAWPVAAAALGLTVGVFAITEVVARGFSLPSSYGVSDLYGVPAPDSFLELTFLDSFAELGESWTEPVEHVARVLLPHAIPLALVAAVAAALLRAGRLRVPPLTWAAAAAWAVTIAPPILVNPDVVAKNETRLGALALPASILALATLLAEAERSRELRISRWGAVLLAVALVAGSLHHLYARVGPTTDGQFAALELAVAAALAAGVYRALRAGRPTLALRGADREAG